MRSKLLQKTQIDIFKTQTRCIVCRLDVSYFYKNVQLEYFFMNGFYWFDTFWIVVGILVEYSTSQQHPETNKSR